MALPLLALSSMSTPSSPLKAMMLGSPVPLAATLFG